MRYSFIIIMLLVSLARAETPLLQTWINIEDVAPLSATNWTVSGVIYDYSALQYTASQVTTGNLLFAQGDYGVVDVYTVSAVNTVIASRVSITVQAALPLAWPIVNPPSTGRQILCAETNGVLFLPSYTANQADEYLVRQAQNISPFFAPVSTNGGSGPSGGISLQDATNVVGGLVGVLTNSTEADVLFLDSDGDLSTRRVR